MDTRSKIVTPAQAPRGAAIAIGRFDVPGVEHARALAALRARSSALIAIVLPAPSQSDPARAAVESLSQPDRARMAAALRMVDYVLIANPHSLQGLLATLEPAEILHLDEIEAALAARRLRRVLEHA